MPHRWGYISVVKGILYGSTAQAMDEDYAMVLKLFLKNGDWRRPEEIPDKLKDRYFAYKKQYPNADDFCLATERYGMLFYNMTSFARGGEFTPKDAVTGTIMTSDKIFAMDVETGELLWEYEGEDIPHITITIGDGKIFFTECAVTKKQKELALQRRSELIDAGTYKRREGILDELKRAKKLQSETTDDNSFNSRALDYLVFSLKAEMFEEENPEGILTYDDADIRMVTALDAVNGKTLWEQPVDLTGCCGDHMGAAFKDGLLFFFGNHGNHDAWRFRIGGMKWRRITALAADTGNMVWSRALNYRTRPLIVGDKIILEPQACDLHTGEIVQREHPVTGKKVPWEFLRPGHTCGLTSASANGLFYRSACTNFYDIEEDSGVTIFGGYRPGCAISLIPACGLLLSQEAAAGCTCSYPIRCSLAMVRKSQGSRPWSVYITPGELKPVKHFAINFGAPADKKDEDGTVWFGYPNPKTNKYTHFPGYGVKFSLSEEIMDEMGYFYRDYEDTPITGTHKPWLFTSGCLGLTSCKVPLLEDGQDSARYTVRLGFKALPEDRSGQRVFKVKLQDQVVLDDFDIIESTKTADQVIVKEFKHIEVDNDLVLELLPQTPSAQDKQAPLINFVEVLCETS